MTMKRYQARDMRAALKQVRDEQGPDAVIVSTQTIPGGVEVCAAADDTERQSQGAMSEELRSLRRLLERQLSALAWNDYTRREPQRAALLGGLMRLGVAREVAVTLSQAPPASAVNDTATVTPESVLAAGLGTTRLPLQPGGIVAFIGPSGSGKSATLAKLAVRHVLEHGPGGLALISMDNTRLGAPEQTRSLARLLGVSVNIATNAGELKSLVATLQHRRLVLIDTAGVALRCSEGMSELRTALAAVEGLQAVLMLPASSQHQVLAEIIRQFAVPQLHSAVLTRVDEARALGGVIGALIAARLPVSATSDGARIPEDLRDAHRDELLARATALADGHGDCADQEFLADCFGGALHAA